MIADASVGRSIHRGFLAVIIIIDFKIADIDKEIAVFVFQFKLSERSRRHYLLRNISLKVCVVQKAVLGVHRSVSRVARGGARSTSRLIQSLFPPQQV